MEILKKTYDSRTSLYSLELINSYFHDNRFDFKLDCQRGTVWTEEQEQNLIDTLVCGERIPEIHAIKDDTSNIFQIADGKQRLTTLLKFMNDKIAWKKKYADIAFHKDIFKDNINHIYFSQLPVEYRNFINSTEITFAVYKNMTYKAITKLFRKLNAGTPLTGFQKGMATNVLLRKNFSNQLLEHPVIPKIFSKNAICTNKAESYLIGLLVLMLAFDKNKELTPVDITDRIVFSKHNFYFPNVVNPSDDIADQWSYILDIKAKQVSRLFDILNSIDKDNIIVNNKGQFIFPLLYAYAYNFSDKEFIDLYLKMQNVSPNDLNLGGSQYVYSAIVKWFDYINKNLI